MFDIKIMDFGPLDRTLLYCEEEYRRIDLVGQRKRKHNICGIRPDHGSDLAFPLWSCRQP